MANKNKKKVVEFSEDAMTIYCHTIYKFLGRNLLKNDKFKAFFNKHVYNKKYESILKKANLKLIPDEYFISIFLSIVLVTILIVISSIAFIWVNILYSAIIFYGGVFFIGILGIFLYNYPVVLSNNRKAEIDASIPYLLPYLKILSKELNLSKILEIIDDFLIYKEVKVEFRKIKYYSDFLGNDIQSSIREAMKSCPSRQLADIMNDLVTISNSGGNIYTYLERKLENLETEIDAIEKKTIDTLLIFSQVYVVLLLISPLFFTIMVSILNLISFTADTGSSGGTDSMFMIMGMLLVLPFIYFGFMMMIYFSKPLYSRLKPIKNI